MRVDERQKTRKGCQVVRPDRKNGKQIGTKQANNLLCTKQKGKMPEIQGRAYNSIGHNAQPITPVWAKPTSNLLGANGRTLSRWPITIGPLVIPHAIAHAPVRIDNPLRAGIVLELASAICV